MVLPLPGAPGAPPPPQAPAPPSNPLAVFQFLPPNLLTPDYGTPVQNSTAQKPTRKKPDIASVITKITDTVAWWKLRDSRMDDDYSRWKLTPPSTGAGVAVVQNTPRVVVEKLANMLGAQVPTIQSDPPSPNLEHLAQKKEDLLRYAWDEWDRAWSNGLGAASIRHAEAYGLGLRGWLAYRVTLKDSNDSDEFPIDLTLFDARNVYPRYGHGKLRYVVQQYSSTVGEVLDEWGKDAEKFFQDRPEGDQVTVSAYYDDWWHCVLVDDQPVKAPEAHEYGFVPWVIRIGGGAPIRASGDTGGDSWIADVGPAFFDAVKDIGTQLDKILSAVATAVDKAADPPAIYYYDPSSGTPQKLDLSAGAQNYVLLNEKIQVLNTSPALPDTTLLLNVMNKNITQGTLPEVLWGGGPDSQSGFAVALLSGAARDATFGIIRAMESAEAEVNRMALSLLRDHYAAPIGIIVKDANGNWVSGETILPSEIAQVGTRNVVKFQDIAPKDRVQMTQQAVVVTDKHLMSRKRAMSELLGIENPEKEIKDILADMTYQDEDIVKNVLNPAALQEMSPNYLFPIWMAWQQFQHVNQQSQSQQPQGPAAPPPPSGVVPGPGTPPPVPPAPMNPNILFNALQHAQASSAGGQGLQQPPGLSGVGGLLPGGIPPQ